MNVEDFGQLPKEADNDGCGKNGAGRDLAIGQHPVDEEEEQDAGESGAESQKGEGDEMEDEVVSVADEYRGGNSLLPGGGSDRSHGEDTDRERKAERDDLVVQIAAVLADSP